MGKKGGRKKASRPYAAKSKNSKTVKTVAKKQKQAKKEAIKPRNESLLKDVPPEYSFWLSDGRVIRNAAELADASANMDEDVYSYHANTQKNDFADWVRDIIQDQPLAYQIRKAASPRQMQRAIYRMLGQKPPRQEMTEPQTTVISAQPPEQVQEQEQIQTQEPDVTSLTNQPPPQPQIPEQLIPNNETKKHEKTQSKKHHESHKHNHTHQKAQPHAQKDTGKDANDEMSELRKLEEHLLNQEKGLSEEEQRLNTAKLELTKKRYDLLKQRGELEKKKFEYFLSKRTSPELTARITEAAHPRSHDFREKMPLEFGKERLEQLIRQAKQDIAQGNAEEAAKRFHEIENTFSRSILTPDEKRSLKYEIMEIEADIRLAALSRR